MNVEVIQKWCGKRKTVAIESHSFIDVWFEKGDRRTE